MTKKSKIDSLERIIAAARDEFTEHGFSGARVDAIAKRAGVNKALLYYHVGGKEALYERVLHNTLGVAVTTMEQSTAALTDPVDKLRVYIRTMLATIKNNPQIPSIILQELAGDARNLPDEVARDFVRMFKLLNTIIAEGMAAKAFRPTTPVLIHFMVVGPAIFHRKVEMMRPRFEAMLDGDWMDRNLDIDREAEIERTVMRAVLV